MKYFIFPGAISWTGHVLLSRNIVKVSFISNKSFANVDNLCCFVLVQVQEMTLTLRFPKLHLEAI